jgi:hypothetical protein
VALRGRASSEKRSNDSSQGVRHQHGSSCGGMRTASSAKDSATSARSPALIGAKYASAAASTAMASSAVSRPIPASLPEQTRRVQVAISRLREQVTSDEGERDRDRDRTGVAPADRRRDDRAEHRLRSRTGTQKRGRRTLKMGSWAYQVRTAELQLDAVCCSFLQFVAASARGPKVPLQRRQKQHRGSSPDEAGTLCGILRRCASARLCLQFVPFALPGATLPGRP